eukprot:jgi/Chrzof1/12378/Cz06g32090.t1
MSRYSATSCGTNLVYNNQCVIPQPPNPLAVHHHHQDFHCYNTAIVTATATVVIYQSVNTIKSEYLGFNPYSRVLGLGRCCSDYDLSPPAPRTMRHGTQLTLLRKQKGCVSSQIPGYITASE